MQYMPCHVAPPGFCAHWPATANIDHRAHEWRRGQPVVQPCTPQDHALRKCTFRCRTVARSRLTGSPRPASCLLCTLTPYRHRQSPLGATRTRGTGILWSSLHPGCRQSLDKLYPSSKAEHHQVMPNPILAVTRTFAKSRETAQSVRLAQLVGVLHILVV